MQLVKKKTRSQNKTEWKEKIEKKRHQKRKEEKEKG